MTAQVFSRPESWFAKNAKALLNLLWGATLVLTFVFAAVFMLTLAVSLAVDSNLVKVPDRVCYPDSAAPGGKQICT